jgi:formate hydrogenlyase subunit 3/multisubunit Na+/H+ antiporter MnhD subunit
MVELSVVLVLSILVQFLVDRIKTVVPYKAVWKLELAPIYALVLGVVLAFVTKVDIIASLGFETISEVGYVVTGIVVSGGSSAVHELLAKLRESRE